MSRNLERLIPSAVASRPLAETQSPARPEAAPEATTVIIIRLATSPNTRGRLVNYKVTMATAALPSRLQDCAAHVRQGTE